MVKKACPSVFFTPASITLLLLFLASCRSARYLEDGQALVTEMTLEGVPDDLAERASAYVSNEIRPNSPLNLTIYNLFNTRNGRYRTDGIRNVGEPPRILDSASVGFSAGQINGFLMTKGYFNATVSPRVALRNKRARIVFHADPRTPFYIGNISHAVADTAVRRIYESEIRPASAVRWGDRFDAGDLLAERERAYITLREHGYYDYVRQYMRVSVDTNAGRHRTDLHFEIQNPEGTARHTVYQIAGVDVRIQPPNGHSGRRAPRSYQDSALNIAFHDPTGRFRLRPLSRYMYVRPGRKYNIAEENRSYDRLYEMNGFRNVRIEYQKVDSNRLYAHYLLVPRPAMANQVEGEFIFSSGMSGFNAGNTFSHRNVLGGAEQLDLRLRYGVLFDPRLPGNLADKVFNNDFQAGVNLIFPKLIVPFGNPGGGKHGLPRTAFSTNLQLFQQDRTYSNQYFTNSINYTWHGSAHAQHNLTPVLLEYRVGRLNAAFAAELENQGYWLYVRSNDRQYFGLGTQYAYTHNAKRLLRLEDFSYFRGGLDLSGGLLDLASRIFDFERNADGERLLFGVPYLQYAKAELDYRWYRYFGGARQLVLRMNGGLAVPYGNNSSLLIFEKSFYAGGMNGNRAWQARTLGPGAYSRRGLNESLRLNLRNLDQLGEIKLETNAEYRFRLLNRFLGARMNGAAFVDAGNVWRLRENELNPGGEFRADRFLSQIAIGTGFGLRLDMDYFVIRLDAGLKVKDPQFSGKDQWVIRDFFRASDFKRAYYEIHRPDRYSFLQYNFGVGLPF